MCSLGYTACNAHAPYCHLWPAPLHNILPHYLINITIFGVEKPFTEHNVCYIKDHQQMSLFCNISLLYVSTLHVSGLYQPIIRGIHSCCYLLPPGSYNIIDILNKIMLKYGFKIHSI